MTLDPTDPLTVECPDCYAPPGTACYSHSPSGVHAVRAETAQVRGTLEHGTCSTCTRPLVRYTLNGALQVIHPDGSDAAACPQMADPSTDWHTYAAQVNAGLEPGKPGLDRFTPTPQEVTP